MSLFATKPLSRIMAESEGEHSLKRTLGPMQLVALGIGAIIGAGLFSLTGIAAAHHAGPAVTISFVIAAIGCAFAGLCYSEFATMIPIAGSAYTYSYATMGELLAWIIGWDLVLEYAVGAGPVAVSWSGYVNSLLLDFGLHLPGQSINSPFSKVTLENGEVVHGIMNVPAILVVGAITAILIIGIQESARVNAVVVVLKVMVVVLFIVVGWAYINPSNYTPYVPENTGLFGHFGWSGVLGARASFSSPSSALTRCRRQPRKRRGRSATAHRDYRFADRLHDLYVLFAHVMTGIAPFMELDSAAPVAVAVDKTPTPG